MKKKEKNKIPFKKILMILLWAVLGSGFFILLGAAIKKQNSNVCKSVKIKIDRGNGIFFVNEKEIEKIIGDRDAPYVGKTIAGIDFTEIERKIERNPFIENAEIFMNMLGEMTIEVEQREPVVRVINNNGVDFYIDRNGNKMPTSSNFTAQVIIATGNITDGESSQEKIDSLPVLKKIFVLAKYLNENDFWDSMIQQIYVSDAGEFELIPRLGNHYILLGDTEGLDEKFRKLMIFYKEGLNNVGWGNYEQINLKYKDQVVCKKY